MKKNLQVLGLALLAFGLVGTARAADVVAPNQKNPNVIIGASETHKNLYTVGGDVTINGNTAGDLTVAGGMVTVDGNVQQELLAAGGTLEVSGSIGGTARILGGNITITGPVGGDLVVAGGNVNITGKSSVAGDVMVAGGNVVIDVPVTGSVRTTGGNVLINNKVGGDVYAQTSQSLEFGSSANIAGTVYHKGPAKAVIDSGAQVPHISYTEWQPRSNKGALAAIASTAFVIRLLAWMIAAWLLAHFKKSWVQSIVDSVRSHPWSNLGWGLLYIIVIPIVTLLLLFTFIGYYLAFLTGISFVLLIGLAKIFGVIAVGYVIVKLLSKPTDGIPMWQPVVIGSVIWALIGLIPIVGWIIIAVVFLQSFGALVRATVGAMKE